MTIPRLAIYERGSTMVNGTSVRQRKPVKLIIQIPCYNEEETLPEVLAALPRSIPGVDVIETLVIDDGSTDRTVDIAIELGVHHVVRHTGNKRLPAAFQSGIDTALKLGADIIVNTDGDHQYPGDQIALLVEPILEGRADIVVGDRQVSQSPHFSPLKKLLQHLGSWVVRQASSTTVPDTVSGFRALSKEAALRLFVTSEFSYTVENLIQAGKRRLTVTHVPIRTNPAFRPSRLHRGNFNFVKRQGATIVRTYAQYEPLKTFSYLAFPFLFIGAVLLGRILLLYVTNNLERGSNVQSLMLGGVFLIVGILTLFFGIIADLIGSTRRLTEEALYRVRDLEVDLRMKYRDLEDRQRGIEEAFDREAERN
jgi:glycosyltransferase involved in cell wall biosynthesis